MPVRTNASLMKNALVEGHVKMVRVLDPVGVNRHPPQCSALAKEMKQRLFGDRENVLIQMTAKVQGGVVE